MVKQCGVTIAGAGMSFSCELAEGHGEEHRSGGGSSLVSWGEPRPAGATQRVVIWDNGKHLSNHEVWFIAVQDDRDEQMVARLSAFLLDAKDEYGDRAFYAVEQPREGEWSTKGSRVLGRGEVRESSSIAAWIDDVARPSAGVFLEDVLANDELREWVMEVKRDNR